MFGSGGHGDQIIGLAEHLQYFIAEVKAEESFAFDEKPHFVFGVDVFVQECLT